MHVPLKIVAALGLTGVVLAAAGCGGGSSPSVASLGTTTNATTTSGAPSFGGAGSTAPPSGSATGRAKGMHVVMNIGSAGVKFSSCMRKHGVTNFPDPDASGEISLSSANGIDPKSPTFQRAQQACQKLLPNGGKPTPAETAKMQAGLLAYSKCMRTHGVPKFPDPTFGNGGTQLSLRAGSGLDPNSAVFKRAQQACGGELPKP